MNCGMRSPTGIANQIGAVNEARGSREPDQPGYRIAIELSQFDAIVGDRVQSKIWLDDYAFHRWS